MGAILANRWGRGMGPILCSTMVGTPTYAVHSLLPPGTPTYAATPSSPWAHPPMLSLSACSCISCWWWVLWLILVRISSASCDLASRCSFSSLYLTRPGEREGSNLH